MSSDVALGVLFSLVFPGEVVLTSANDHIRPTLEKLYPGMIGFLEGLEGWAA